MIKILGSGQKKVWWVIRKSYISHVTFFQTRHTLNTPKNISFISRSTRIYSRQIPHSRVKSGLWRSRGRTCRTNSTGTWPPVPCAMAQSPPLGQRPRTFLRGRASRELLNSATNSPESYSSSCHDQNVFSDDVSTGLMSGTELFELLAVYLCSSQSLKM